MLKKISKVFIEVLFLIFIICLLIGHRMVIYGASQGIGQLTIVMKAQPIEDVMKDGSFPDSLKRKLITIKEIKNYAVDSLGIKASNNYSTVYNQQNKSILLTVTACEPYKLKAKEWWFPFLGTVSYIGYFNKKEAKKEVLLLKGKGFDVDVYCPSGWSTLGWFKDPIQSNMLKQSDGSLANLIIHELTHGTLYVKNDVTFNENLANFIGDKGAEQFLIYKYGKESKEYKKYEEGKADESCYKKYMLKSVDRLDSLYSALSAKDSEEIKKVKKTRLISEIVVGVYRLPLFKKKNYFNYSLHAFAEGNAFFMSFSRYDSKYEVFEKEYEGQFHSNLQAYLQAMKQKYPSL